MSQRFALGRLVGRGATGSVYEAEDRQTGARVALKLLHPALIRRRGVAVARWSREVAITSSMKSAHYPRVVCHHADNEGAFIALEMLEGESLRERIERTGRMTMPQVAQMLAQAAEALGEAHAMGIVHRDIKPSNLFLAGKGAEIHLKILDFGIARLHGSTLTPASAMLGSPRYMSPEQYRSASQVDARADLWGLAATAFYALTGLPCFQGNGLVELSQAVLSHNHARPSSYLPGLDPDVDIWFMRAFTKDVRQRYQSAQELTQSFSALAARLSLGAPRSMDQAFAEQAPSWPTAPQATVTQAAPWAANTNAAAIVAAAPRPVLPTVPEAPVPWQRAHDDDAASPTQEWGAGPNLPDGTMVAMRAYAKLHATMEVSCEPREVLIENGMGWDAYQALIRLWEERAGADSQTLRALEDVLQQARHQAEQREILEGGASGVRLTTGGPASDVDPWSERPVATSLKSNHGRGVAS